MENYRSLLLDKDYYDIDDFIEKLYLEKNCLIILMARKFFSLFLTFQEISKKKYEKLGLRYKGNSRIITNYALPLLKKDIVDSKYKKIIIADDIIIHGRGIKDIYLMLKEWNSKCEIRIVSYIRNDEDTGFYDDIIDQIDSRYCVGSGYWKEISTKIVDSFYMSGRPYISYLPYLTLNNSWKELCEMFDSNDCYAIDNEVMRRHSVEGFLYTGKLVKIFQNQKFSLICALRLYNYREIDKRIMIPYFCMDMINNESLKNVSERLRNNNLLEAYINEVRKNDNAEELRIRELEYVFSYWMAIYVVDLLGLSVNQWCFDVEPYSFGCDIVYHEDSTADNILEKLDGFRDIEITKVKRLINNEDIQLLLSCYEDLKEKYSLSSEKWSQCENWESNESSYERRLVEELLYKNGVKDEDRIKGSKSKTSSEDSSNIKDKNGVQTETEKKYRLLGIPLSVLIKNLSKYFKQFDDKPLIYHKSIVFASIISAIDSGKGSIFTRIIKSKRYKNVCQYGSLLHAGEQNYVFLDNSSFPAMYAYFMIEQLVNKENLEAAKADFTKDYIEFLENNDIFYNKEELQQLEKMDISTVYGRYLRLVYCQHRDNKTVKQANASVTKIVAKTANEY